MSISNSIHEAINNNQPAQLTDLIQADADINAKDSEGRAPFHIAAREGNIRALEILSKARADINAKDPLDDTPLHYAVRKQDLSAVEALCQLGAKVDAENVQHSTPLQCSASKKAIDIVATLILHGANIAQVDRFGATILDLLEDDLSYADVKLMEDALNEFIDKKIEASIGERFDLAQYPIRIALKKSFAFDVLKDLEGHLSQSENGRIYFHRYL